MKFMGNMQAMAHAAADDEVLQNLFALYSFEHFEIASYTSLIAMAEHCGEANVAQVCRQILQQEEDAASKLEALIKPVTQTYLQLESAAKMPRADAPVASSALPAGC